MIIPWIWPHHIQEDIQQYQGEIGVLQEEQQELVKKLETMTASIQDYNAKIHELNKLNGEGITNLRQAPGTFTQLVLDTNEYNEVEKVEEGLLRRMDDLEKYIQKSSARFVLKKFGPEPHRVKVNVTDLRGVASSFVIEMAPLNEAPHAVYYFLQTVDQNLWNGLVMMLEGGVSAGSFNHWMASPMRMDLRHGKHSWENARFEKAKLNHLAFTEHSSTYPPPGKFQYSVAFSGHPGGPNFYVRLDQDSSEEHISDIHQQASTFGMVVEGIDVLERYFNHKATAAVPGKTSHMQLLTIESMELLRNDLNNNYNNVASAKLM